MKTTSLAIMSVAILGIGLFGISSASFNDVSEASSLSSGESTGVLGHVTAVHKNADGEVLLYSQSDNVVVNQGEQGITRLLFGSQNSTDGLAANEAFNEIGLFNQLLGAPSTSTTFANVDANTFTGALARTEITRNDEGTTGNCADQVLGNTIAGKTYLQCTFTSDQSALVYGAYITNNGTSDTLFAAQNFTSTSTGIQLNNADQLTVTWDITLPGN
jgi:hypothetical protein